MKLYQPIQLRHLAGLDGVDDVDVGLHGLVVVVAGPFHYDVRRDAEGEGVNYEGAAAAAGGQISPPYAQKTIFCAGFAIKPSFPAQI